MRYLLASLLCLFSATALSAEPPALVVTKAGFYYVVTDDDGVPTLVKVTKVITIGDVPPTDTPPPDEPDPPTTVETQVRDWAAEVDHPVGAQSLALVYRTIAEKVDDGSLDPGDAYPAIKSACDQVLPTVNAGTKWDGWRVKVGELITTKSQAGELSLAKDIAKFLNEVADGLDSSATSAPALDPEIISAIIALILRLLELFGVGGGGETPGPV